jgi:hypothetical protein
MYFKNQNRAWFSVKSVKRMDFEYFWSKRVESFVTLMSKNPISGYFSENLGDVMVLNAPFMAFPLTSI